MFALDSNVGIDTLPTKNMHLSLEVVKTILPYMGSQKVFLVLKNLSYTMIIETKTVLSQYSKQ
jgi:hypothetical protein